MTPTVHLHRLVAQKLCAETFAPFGIYAHLPEREPDWIATGSRIEGVREGTLQEGTTVAKLWKLSDLIFTDDKPYLGLVKYFHQGFKVAQLERHINETQTWLVRRGTSFLVVAPRTESDKLPNPKSAVAFLIEPGDLVSIGVGVWMCHFFPIFKEGEYIVITARRDPEQDRDVVDLIATANTVIEIVLS
jgi:ureidoglycolate hydrolase